MGASGRHAHQPIARWHPYVRRNTENSLERAEREVRNCGTVRTASSREGQGQRCKHSSRNSHQGVKAGLLCDLGGRAEALLRMNNLDYDAAGCAGANGFVVTPTPFLNTSVISAAQSLQSQKYSTRRAGFLPSGSALPGFLLAKPTSLSMR